MLIVLIDQTINNWLINENGGHLEWIEFIGSINIVIID